MPEHFSKRNKHLHANCVYNVKVPQNAPTILISSGASNLRSLQATNLKCAEYVDKLVQVIHAKFKNDRSHRKGHFKKIVRISAVCISLLCYNSMSKLLPYVARDTGNNLLVQ